MTKQKDEKVDVSRRSFFTRTAKAAGGLAAACVAATGLTKAVTAASASASAPTVKSKAGYAQDNQQQLEKMSKQQMVLMSNGEKDQMLDEILRHHYKETA